MRAFTFAVLLCLFVGINAHGRFMKPPNRSSLWRFPEFASQNPPPNYQDNELFCGGIHQTDAPGTNCGVCGDPRSQSTPRNNEIGGQFYKGIIAATYRSGQVIDVEAELTAGHLGYMEWRLCTSPLSGETQSCFDRHVLQLETGGTRFPAGGSGWYRTRVRLPAGVTCNHCVIQWNYRAGNNWGQCSDGTSGQGCGPQETFRGCSDVRITN